MELMRNIRVCVGGKQYFSTGTVVGLGSTVIDSHSFTAVAPGNVINERVDLWSLSTIDGTILRTQLNETRFIMKGAAEPTFCYSTLASLEYDTSEKKFLNKEEFEKWLNCSEPEMLSHLVGQEFRTFVYKAAILLDNFLNDNFPYTLKAIRDANICVDPRLNVFKTMWTLCTKYPAEFERAIKIAPTLIKGRIVTEPAEQIVAVGGKQLPSRILSFIGESEATRKCPKAELTKLFQLIVNNEDGNNAVIMMDYLRASDMMRDKRGWTCENDENEFIKSLSSLISRGYNSKDLLEYLIRQNFYYNNFRRPYEEAKQFRDYIFMATENGLAYERWPSNVFKAHTTMANNVKTLNVPQEVADQFVKVVSARAKSIEAEEGDYVLLAPKTHVEIVEEGNALNHCVGSYVPRISRGETFVAFLRKKSDTSKSFVTIELDDKNKIIQAKGVFNEDVPSEVNTVLAKLQKKIAV